MAKNKNRSPEAEFKDYLARADSGDEETLFCIGFCYLQGYGTKRDVEKGEYWLRKAADNGGRNAQYYLSVIYRDGQDVEANQEEAMKYCKMAAESGHPKAMYNLASYYYDQKDFNKAEELFSRAALAGEPNAVCNLGLLYYNRNILEGTEARLDDLSRAKFWLALAKKISCSEPTLADRAYEDTSTKFKHLLKECDAYGYDLDLVKSTVEVARDLQDDMTDQDTVRRVIAFASILISEGIRVGYEVMANLIANGKYYPSSEHDVNMLKMMAELLGNKTTD